MTATMTIAFTMAISMLKLLRTLGVTGREPLRLRERVQTLVPLVLALAIVALGTVVYLELVRVLLVALE